MSSFTRHDYELAYLAVFAAVGIVNVPMASKLADLTQSSSQLIAACQEMRKSLRSDGRLEPYPGAVNRALDLLEGQRRAS